MVSPGGLAVLLNDKENFFVLQDHFTDGNGAGTSRQTGIFNELARHHAGGNVKRWGLEEQHPLPLQTISLYLIIYYSTLTNRM